MRQIRNDYQIKGQITAQICKNVVKVMRCMSRQQSIYTQDFNVFVKVLEGMIYCHDEEMKEMVEFKLCDKISQYPFNILLTQHIKNQFKRVSARQQQAMDNIAKANHIVASSEQKMRKSMEKLSAGFEERLAQLRDMYEQRVVYMSGKIQKLIQDKNELQSAFQKKNRRGKQLQVRVRELQNKLIKQLKIDPKRLKNNDSILQTMNNQSRRQS